MLDVHLRRKPEASQRTTVSEIKASRKGGGAWLSQQLGGHLLGRNHRRDAAIFSCQPATSENGRRRRALSGTCSEDIWDGTLRVFVNMADYLHHSGLAMQTDREVSSLITYEWLLKHQYALKHHLRWRTYVSLLSHPVPPLQ